ncbi:MAG TPA: protein translocase subunit SecD [Anaerolineaceae bacterium]|nr:protein translocase subunit SecD [Anaerolineaceae bacterium]
MNRNSWTMLLIGLILIFAIWIVSPLNTGINVLGFTRSGTQPLGLDLRGGLQVILQASPPPGQTSIDPQSLQDTKQILANRSNALGVSEITFQVSGNNRIVGEFPGLTNTDQVIAALKQVGQLAFIPMGNERLQEGSTVAVDYNKTWSAAQPYGTATQAATPTGQPGATSTPKAETSATPAPTETPTKIYYPLMTGTALSSVAVTTDSLGKYEISFVLKDQYKQIFGDFTANHVNEILGIVLDNKLISAPSINSAIPDGKGVIQGSFTYESANALAINLRYGSLPVALTVIESRAVGATLGQDSINKSILAGIIGLTLVIILMLVNYRLPGFIAVLALGVYAMINLALFKLIPVTLSLPGIAGFVLSIGMAVDANILIFERLKEELRAGRQLHTAIDLAWRRAWPSIRDSNISTLITCLILFIFGSTYGASFVSGFAVNLALGVGVSLFTAIIVTRTFLHVALDNLRFVEHPAWYGI